MMPASGRYKGVVLDFMKYAVVGGVAFAVDFGVMVGCREFIFPAVSWGVYASVAFGFFAGLTVNYLLSMVFVFSDRTRYRDGWTWSAFCWFAAIGVAGVILTEFGMWVGYGLLRFNYMAVKVVVSGCVLIWNFLGRRILLAWRSA